MQVLSSRNSNESKTAALRRLEVLIGGACVKSASQTLGDLQELMRLQDGFESNSELYRPLHLQRSEISEHYSPLQATPLDISVLCKIGAVSGLKQARSWSVILIRLLDERPNELFP